MYLFIFVNYDDVRAKDYRENEMKESRKRKIREGWGRVGDMEVCGMCVGELGDGVVE